VRERRDTKPKLKLKKHVQQKNSNCQDPLEVNEDRTNHTASSVSVDKGEVVKESLTHSPTLTKMKRLSNPLDLPTKLQYMWAGKSRLPFVRFLPISRADMSNLPTITPGKAKNMNKPRHVQDCSCPICRAERIKPLQRPTRLLFRSTDTTLVRATLHRHGFEQGSGGDFLLLWSCKQLSSQVYCSLNRHQKVNMVKLPCEP
jgi:hypothetical protein